MRKNSFRIPALLLVIALFGLFMAVCVQAQTPNGVILYMRGNKQIVNGVNQKYILVDDLSKTFKFPVESLEGGRAVRVGHLYYNKNVVPYGGKAYVEAETFFRFFDMAFTRVNDWTYTMNTIINPMFFAREYKHFSNGTVSINNAATTSEVLKVKERYFIPLESLQMQLGRSTKDSLGRVTLNGKIIDRWIPYGDKTFAYADDVKNAIGKPLTVTAK